MKALFLALVTLAATSASAAPYTYKYDNTWDGEVLRQSSAPQPRCECDIDWNVMDCGLTPGQQVVDYKALSFKATSDQGEVCSDEYISPAGVLANIFKRQ